MSRREPLLLCRVLSPSNPILIVDDDDGILEALSEVVAELGPVVTARNGLAALRHCENGLKPRAIILDWVMPHLTGEAFLERLAAVCSPLPPVIVITASNRIVPTSAAIRAVLRKPFTIDDLLRALGEH